MEDRLISVNKLKDHYAWWSNENKKLFDSIVDLQPTVEAEPIRHGKWVHCKDTIDGVVFVGSECSICNYWKPSGTWNYCPNCGAKMDGEDNAVSFNGRTRGFDPCDAGSIPAAATNQMEREGE